MGSGPRRPPPAPHSLALPRTAPHSPGGHREGSGALQPRGGAQGGRAGPGGAGLGPGKPQPQAERSGAVRCGAGRAPAMTIGGPRGGGQPRLQMPCLGKVSRHRAGTGRGAGGGTAPGVGVREE